MSEPTAPSEPDDPARTATDSADLDIDVDPVERLGAVARQRTFAFERDIPAHRAGGQPS